MNPIKDVVIVGGGTAGLIAALYFKKYFPQFNVKVVKSSSVGIIGVGEGTTEQFNYFLDDLNLNHLELIIKTKATVKIGILFNDWNYVGDTYSHTILNDYPLDNGIDVLEIYNRFVLNSNNDPYALNSGFKEVFLQNKVPLNQELRVGNQYHFDTFALNSYLIEKCNLNNISIENHHIKDIQLDNQGNISYLISSEGNNIKGDFFIDCSGFKRILSSKLDVKWQSYNQYLPTNRAITLATPLNLSKGIEPYTKCTALSSGWTWKIPTQERYGNGYVFDNRYTDSDNALNEFNQHLGINAEKIAKDIKFEAGKVDKFWEKNCVSVGLAGSFAEPLEAQSISFSIIQLFLLMKSFNSWVYDKNISKKYNETINDVFDNIVNYIQLHYLTQRKDSKFWKDKPFKLTEFNKNTLQRFSLGIFNYSDFNNPYLIFKPANFYQIYYGSKLLNIPKIKELQKYNSKEYNEYFDKSALNYLKTLNPFQTTISHIDYLKLVKENYSS